jgi:TetR/AcrR family transcriptional repressor of nem operon
LVYFCSVVTKSERTRQFIIERSAPLFNKKGYAGTSMADIQEATGLTKGGIYGNFDSKDEIAAEAFEYAMDKVKQALQKVIREEKTSIARLDAILSFYHNYSVSPIVEGGCPLLNAAIDSDDTMPFLKEKARESLKQMLDTLLHIIQKGIKYGEFKADINTTEEAEYIFAVIEGGIMMSKLTDNPSILNRLLANLKTEVRLRLSA